MLRTFLLVWCALIALVSAPIGVMAQKPAASPQPTVPGSVLVLTLAGPITPVAANYVERGLREAENRHVTAVVLRLDTPGGLDSAMRDIVQDMVASRVPVIVY